MQEIPAKVGEVWHISIGGSSSVSTYRIDEITEKTVLVSYEDRVLSITGIQGTRTSMRYVLSKVNFLEKVGK